MDNNILLGHGSGGKLSHDLIDKLFIRYFHNEILDEQTDSAILDINAGSLAFTTDSFVVDPVFFPGGNIGKLAIAGTVNDLAVSGADPAYLSASFIIEEGLSFKDLEIIVRDMAQEAEAAGIKIVTGDTKVVNRGKADKVFITTSGIGILAKQKRSISYGENIIPGDNIIINGYIADHGMAVLAAREFKHFESSISSDCACLNHLIKKACKGHTGVKFMRDATRGGLATVIAELVSKRTYGIEINEDSVPVREEVRGMCELLGYDPMYVANEGKVVIVVSSEDTDSVLANLKSDPLGKNARVIGQVVQNHAGRAWINTIVGGKRILDMMAGEQLPRIC